MSVRRGFWSQSVGAGEGCSPSLRHRHPLRVELVNVLSFLAQRVHTTEEVLVDLLAVGLWDKPGLISYAPSVLRAYIHFGGVCRDGG